MHFNIIWSFCSFTFQVLPYVLRWIDTSACAYKSASSGKQKQMCMCILTWKRFECSDVSDIWLLSFTIITLVCSALTKVNELLRNNPPIVYSMHLNMKWKHIYHKSFLRHRQITMYKQQQHIECWIYNIARVYGYKPKRPFEQPDWFSKLRDYQIFTVGLIVKCQH